MTIENEKKLIQRLKSIGLREGSESWADYEKVKKLLRQQELSPAENDKATRVVTEFLNCTL